jgi:hypothetical protein
MRRNITLVPYRQLTSYEKKRFWKQAGKTFVGTFLTTLALCVILSSKAHADITFTMCGDAREGVVGSHTTCAFAENVRKGFFLQNMPRQFTAFSPSTGQAYDMECGGLTPAHFVDGRTLNTVRCYGGDGAVVVIW